MINVAQNGTSEVARIRAAIELECQALNNFMGFSRVGSHDIISARYKALDEHHNKLKAVMSEEEATSTIVAIRGMA